MGFTIKKQKGIIFVGIFGLALTAFISYLGLSIVDTIWAIYVKSFVGSESLVAFVSSFLALLSFASFFFIVPLIEKSNKSKIFLFSLFAMSISYFIFSITKNFFLFLAIAILTTIFQTIKMTSFGIIVKDTSQRKNLSRNEGLMYTFMNLSWAIGPLIVGLLSNYFNINIMFSLSAILFLIALVYFSFLKIRGERITKKVDKNVFVIFADFFKNKDRVIAYFLGGGVNFWWSLIYIFMPLYIISNNLNVSHVGYFLFAIAVPLILLNYFFSKIAGKIGFKKIFKMGFFIPALMSLICFFISNIYLIMFFLILASIGLAMIEPTTEAYFFDILKGKEDLRFYGPYNTTIDVNHFISRTMGGLVLLFLPFKYIFLFFSLSMLVFFLLSFKTKNVIEIKRKN